MDREQTTSLPVKGYLTVGRLLEKLQFEDVENRICICVENPEEMPPNLVTLMVDALEGDLRELWVWTPSKKRVVISAGENK